MAPLTGWPGIAASVSILAPFLASLAAFLYLSRFPPRT